MYAVIKTGGKQYRVAANDVIKIERTAGEVGEVVSFDDVLMVGGESPTVGTPKVEGASVAGVVLEQARADKITVFKKKRRHNYRRKKGHRQHLTVVRIAEVLTGGKKAGDYKDLVDTAKTKAEQKAERRTPEGQSAASAAALAAAAVAAGTTVSLPKKSKAAKAAAKAASKSSGGKATAKAKTAKKADKSSADTKAEKVEARSSMADEGAGVSARFTAPAGKPDNLDVILGIGDKIEEQLHAMGVTKFEQIANFTDEDIAYVNEQINFKGRVEREDWVGQAKKLHSGTGLLFDKPEGDADDLTKINGVGPELQERLNLTGITQFQQIAEFSQNDIETVDERLDFKGRVEREEWVAQAKDFVKVSK